MTDIATDPDYWVTWPVDVFRVELEDLWARGNLDQVKHLVEEAFQSSGLSDRIEEDRRRARTDYVGLHQPASYALGLSDRGAEWKTASLIYRGRDSIRQTPAPKPYFANRSTTPVSAEAGVRMQRAQLSFARLVGRLDLRGYLNQAFGVDCVDEPRDDPAPLVEEKLGISDLWPLTPPWTDDVFYSLVEVFHDLVARPRSTGNYHNYAECGYHYADFALKPGRGIYSYDVNELLSAHQLPYRLETRGESSGRLVSHTGDARDELVSRALAREDDAAAQVEHALSLALARDASPEAKRSAIVSLYGVLESDRDGVIKRKLKKKDEDALFNIANNFALRHHRAGQQSDYGDEFLDWIFWIALATTDLVQELKESASKARPGVSGVA